MIDLKDFTIESLRKSLTKKEFSCVEMAEDCLAKIKKENKQLNNFLEITDKLAISQAEKIDEKIARREKLEGLEGAPIALKDNLMVEGQRTTAGSKILKDYIAPYDATVVKKLKNSGAIILGKTNLDEFAMGSSTENSAFGVVKNPRDLTRVPGGSSGGSAAAVAANQCLGALGSDTGGSIREPAAFCGIFGFKPSYGMVSRYGLIAMASSLDQIGPFAKNAEDIKTIFNAIKGKDRMDSTSAEIAPPVRKSEFETLQIGVPREFFGEGIDKQVKEKVEKAINKFLELGYEIKEISLPYSEYALAAYYIIAPAEISANLARYDGIKYGYSASKSKNLLDYYCKTRANGLGDEVRRRIMLGTYVLSAGYRDAYYNKAQKVRAIIARDFKNIFSGKDKVDFILTPTTPAPAFKIGDKKDPLAMYLCDIYTVPANLAGLPAISVPCGEADGLPIGLQIIGPQFADDSVLNLAQTFEQLK